MKEDGTSCVDRGASLYMQVLHRLTPQICNNKKMKKFESQGIKYAMTLYTMYLGKPSI